MYLCQISSGSFILGILSLCLIGQAYGVASPLDIVSEDMRDLKSTMSSIQATLMTSVGLIQDQVSDLNEKLSTQLDSRLISIERKLENLHSEMKAIKGRLSQLEMIQPHIQGIASRADETDKKLEHFARTHSEQLSESNRDGQFRLEGIERKVSEMGLQVQTLDTRLIDLQEKSEIFSTLEISMKNISSRSHLPRHVQRMQCHENKDILHHINNKVDTLMTKLKVMEAPANQPRFEYLRSVQDPDNLEGEMVDQHEDINSDDKIINTIRKMLMPYKRANKKLKEVELEQERIGEKIVYIGDTLTSSVADVNRKLGDLSVTTMDMFQSQSHTMEGFGKTMAAILQCCRGRSDDFNRFLSTSSPILERLDSWMVSWRSEVTQTMDKMENQMSYNSDKLAAEYKNLEKMLLEGMETSHLQSQDENPIVSEREDRIHETSTEAVTAQTTEKTIYRDQPKQEGVYYDCMDLYDAGSRESKVYKLGAQRDMNFEGRDYNQRYCDMQTDGGGWTVIQNRGDYGEPRTNFTSNWYNYKMGFGNLQGEFWLGNEYISRLTHEHDYCLRIDLESWDGSTAYAEYSSFRLSPESDDYTLYIGGYSGNASDSLTVHNGYKFSTYDRINDNAPSCCPCAPAYGGGWWFYSCFESNLNGEYYTDPKANGYYRGIIWELWLGDYSLKSAKMMIRPTWKCEELPSSVTTQP